MPTQKERKQMKRVLRKIRKAPRVPTDGAGQVSAYMHPGLRVPTRVDAYNLGNKDGYHQGKRDADGAAEMKVHDLEDKLKDRAIVLEALKNTCQAGATIIDAMAHAIYHVLGEK